MKVLTVKKLVITAVVMVAAAFLVPKPSQAGSVSTRAVWFSFYEYSMYGLKNQTEAGFTSNAKKIFKTIKESGCNTVYMHVRMFDDAIYPSKVVKWSDYIATNGSKLGYDPLKILVKEAHKKKLQIHAWMNPYRVTVSKILNPAKKKTINRIVKQVKEIINNYDVDGIHFDDYFYNSTSYKKVKAKTRRKNVNKMIKKVYKTVKKKNKNLLFGVSPAGNFEYSMSIGADVKTWMSKKGYIDYIVPQIYWSDKYKLVTGKYTKLFTERYKYWTSMNKIDLPMYIGLGLYRAGLKPDNQDKGWKKKNTNLKEQLKMIKAGNTEGYALFTYGDLTASHAKKELKNFFKELAWIRLNETKIKLKKGKTFQLTSSWYPARYSGSTIKYKSLNEELATVSSKGVITALASEGTVKIQAYCGKKTKNCTVTLE
ncbi:MAG: family 10 glycosylhydrolase [Eubacterium sp.]|nr:family 10 glycosylhydrolase [Eubacterium sp.]